MKKKIKYSVLDLARYSDKTSISQAFQNSKELAQFCEELGYERFWLAEHHNIEGIASAATSILINHVASGTKSIRVGSGGIMLPNHSPLVIAEQFATLEALHPGRIDMGLGRAPGSDQTTMRALRRVQQEQDFGEMIEELLYYLSPAEEGQKLRAIPGSDNLDIPLWILGSSLYSAHLAAAMGRPYSFAGHFAPRLMLAALEIYRSEFQPSQYLKTPYVMVGAAVIAGSTDEEAEFLATTPYQSYLSLIRGRLGPARPPVKNMDEVWSPQEKNIVLSQFGHILVGSKKKLQNELAELVQATQADELIITSDPYDFEERKKSFKIISEVMNSL